VVDTLHFQVSGQQPSSIPTCRFTRDLTTDEEPYLRSVKPSPEWTKLDSGFIAPDGCAMLRIASDAKSTGTVELRSGPDSDTLLLPPGESMRFQPSDLARWELRCVRGHARCSVVVLPL
jgi:hypothetical protein